MSTSKGSPVHAYVRFSYWKQNIAVWLARLPQAFCNDPDMMKLRKGSGQTCYCICWKCSIFNPSMRTKNFPDLYPMTIHGVESGNNNIVQLQVENQHSHVCELSLKRNILKDTLCLVQWMIKGIVHCILLQCLESYHPCSLL